MEASGGQAWESAVRASRDGFARAFIDGMPVFASNDDLARRFDALFDGAEILPTGMVAEYRSLLESRPGVP